MTRPVLKVVAEPTLDGPREELRLAILDVEQAEAASAKSQAAVDLASDHPRAMKLAHGRVGALDEARAGQRPLAERLAAAGDDDERFQIVDEHNGAVTPT